VDYFYAAAKRRSQGALWPIFALALINADAAFDSLCASCLEIVASAPREEQLSTSELMHVCDPIRLYQISQGRIIHL
jgi:hypothetical protein